MFQKAVEVRGFLPQIPLFHSFQNVMHYTSALKEISSASSSTHHIRLSILQIQEPISLFSVDRF
jgi:hypothetical protein